MFLKPHDVTPLLGFNVQTEMRFWVEQLLFTAVLLKISFQFARYGEYVRIILFQIRTHKKSLRWHSDGIRFVAKGIVELNNSQWHSTELTIHRDTFFNSFCLHWWQCLLLVIICPEDINEATHLTRQIAYAAPQKDTKIWRTINHSKYSEWS